MYYGITDAGFVRKTFDKIKSDLDTSWKNKFGQDSDISEDSPNAMIIALVSEVADELWATAEDSYNSLKRQSASGSILENSLSLVGVERNESSATTVNVSFRGDNGTQIPTNTQVKQSSTNLLFQNLSDSEIINTKTNWIKLQINSLSNNTIYSIIIDGTSYQYTSDADATNDEVVDGVKALIDAASLGLTVTNDGSGVVIIESTDKSDVYDISSNGLFDFVEVQSIISTTCTTTGKNVVAIETIDSISTAVSGLNSVTNYVAGQTGADTETDQDFRVRGKIDQAVIGFSFAEAIKSKILNDIIGASYARVYQNESMVTDSNSIPAKSWEAVVEGGSNDDIASLLYKMKIAGMRSHGDLTVAVNDNDGISHNIKFSRPSNLYFWIKITVNSYNSEESFPTNGSQAIKDAIISFANEEFNIGDNIIIQKFYEPVFEIDGIGDITIEMDATNATTDTPTYASNSINCSIRQKPNFDLSRISIVLPV